MKSLTKVCSSEVSTFKGNKFAVTVAEVCVPQVGHLEVDEPQVKAGQVDSLEV